jgi:enoyl-CoA hydratase/carnithine racemase
VGSADAPVWTAAQAAALLADPAALEDLLDAPALVLDLREGAPGEPPDALHRAPCPVLAMTRPDAATDWPVDLALEEGSADVALLGADAEAAVAVLVAGASASPAAAGLLAQVLRATRSLSVADALVVESVAYSLLLTGPDFAHWLAERRLPRAAASGENGVVVRREGPLLELTLDRPSVRNAYDVTVRDALVEALSIAVHDPGVARVVLRGNGPAFCSGGDLRDFGTSTDLVRAHAVRTARHPGALLHALADRVEVHVHGACVGAGVELPAFAGRVIARADAVFQLPEVAMGTIPGAGGTVSLPRRIGPQRTLLLALSGLRLTATDALRWGLVDEVVEALPEPMTSADRSL